MHARVIIHFIPEVWLAGAQAVDEGNNASVFFIEPETVRVMHEPCPDRFPLSPFAWRETAVFDFREAVKIA